MKNVSAPMCSGSSTMLVPPPRKRSLARALDVTYIGPSPVLNAYAKSKGTDLRVLAGAANGGSALVVRPGANIKTAADLKGKKIATPQLGNTQDVQLRAYLADNGFKISQTGGDAFILPTQNADQLALFRRGISMPHGLPSPGRPVSNSKQARKCSSMIGRPMSLCSLAALSLLRSMPTWPKNFVAAHQELTQWIKDHPAEAKALIKAELTELMKSTPKDELIDKALSRIVITDEVSRPSLDKMVTSAQKAGFLKDIPALDQLFPKL